LTHAKLSDTRGVTGSPYRVSQKLIPHWEADLLGSGPSEKPAREVLTVPEVAFVLGISRASAYRAARSGELPIGTVAGLACAACRHIEPIPGAPYIVDRHRVVLIPRG
jgi:hypothetical protein